MALLAACAFRASVFARPSRPAWTPSAGRAAAMRAKVGRLLAKYDYPPDKEERAIELVLEQAEAFAGVAA